MSGGKGGTQSSAVEIPKWLEDAAMQNVARAQSVQNMPYTPVMGPTLAGFTAGQKAGMSSQAALAQRMGILPQSYDPSSGFMQGAQDAGNGLSSYGSFPGAKQRVATAFQEFPNLKPQLESLYNMDPYQDPVRAMEMESASLGTLEAAIRAAKSGDMERFSLMQGDLAEGDLTDGQDPFLTTAELIEYAKKSLPGAAAVKFYEGYNRESNVSDQYPNANDGVTGNPYSYGGGN
tara:strand:- start:324 stop:1022 length:699 start_codon:yes stop_codon:yes gene_type:complete